MGMLFLLLGFVLYFIPSFVANSRNHQSFAGIFVLNIFLGWTFVFWVLALVWAYSGENRSHLPRSREKVRVPPQPKVESVEWQPDETRRQYEERTARAETRRLS